MAVPEPILSEKMPPYCFAHSLNLRSVNFKRFGLEMFRIVEHTVDESSWLESA